MASIPRQWTEQETKQFVVFMEELVVEGKMADAGQFKLGAFQKLADKMNEKFLGCGLTVKHIRHKHKQLKEKYMYVTEMLGCSDFGWNSEKMCVEVDSKQVLEVWGKGRNVTLYTPGKPFLLFERLGNIFGKDRATGVEACSEKDAEEDVTPGSTFAAATTGGLGLGSEDVDMEDLAAAESELPSTFSTSFASSSEKNQGRQSATKKTNDAAILSNLTETFKSAVEDQGKHVQVLANAMSGVNDQVNLGRTLKSLGFDTMEILQVAKKFVQNPELKATFWSLDEENAAFVRDIMDNF
ncbi:Myb/SANT-like domain-containing protein [Arachis hypogaea]|nr:Myb/SANT-like domain-containing protein [Arachis hypogaea]